MVCFYKLNACLDVVLVVNTQHQAGLVEVIGIPYRLSAVSLEDFVDAMIQYLLEYYAQVYERFRGRYLEFGKVDLKL